MRFGFLFDAAVNAVSTRSHRMTSTEEAELLGTSALPQRSTSPGVQVESTPYSYSFATSRGSYSSSAPYSHVTIASSKPTEPLAPARPHFVPPKPEKAKDKLHSDYVKEAASLMAAKEELGRTVERLRREVVQHQKEQDGRQVYIRRLRNDYDELERKYTGTRQKLSQVTRSHEQALQQVTSLERQYEEMETLKNGSEAALAEVRQFVTTSDRSDGNFLLQKLADWNALVDELAYNTSTQLSDPEQPLAFDHFLHLAQLLPDALRPLALQAAHHPDPRSIAMDDASFGFSRAIIHSYVTSTVWNKFLWDLDSTLDDFLVNLSRTLYDAEPPMIHARWRSLTYKTLLRTVDAGDAAAKGAVHILDALTPLHRQILSFTCRSLDQKLLEQWVADLEKIITSAYELHKLVREEYLSTNFGILCPAPSDCFNPETMERAEGPKKCLEQPRNPQELVIACVGAGLTRMVWEDDGKGQRIVRAYVVKKAEVLTTCWLEKKEEDGGKMACD